MGDVYLRYDGSIGSRCDRCGNDEGDGCHYTCGKKDEDDEMCEAELCTVCMSIDPTCPQCDQEIE